LPETLRPQFYEMVARDLKRADPVTDSDVAGAIQQALQSWSPRFWRASKKRARKNAGRQRTHVSPSWL
jgi:hypothetical protein